MVSSLRTVPKPGYGLKSATLPAVGRNGGPAGMVISCCLFFMFFKQLTDWITITFMLFYFASQWFWVDLDFVWQCL